MNSENSSNSKPKKRPGNFVYDFVKVTGCIPVWLMARPKIYRLNKTKTPKGAFMVTANHPTPFDPITLLLTFPTRRLHNLGTANLFKTKIGAWFFTRMHIMPVDKEHFNPAVFRDLLERLAEGHPVTIYPEGRLTTKDEGAIQTFKSGAVLMAYKAGVSIIPVYIHKRDKWYQRQRVVVGESVNVVELVGKLPTKAALAHASEVLREKELELQHHLESLPIGKRLLKKHEKVMAKKAAKAKKKAEKLAKKEAKLKKEERADADN